MWPFTRTDSGSRGGDGGGRAGGAAGPASRAEAQPVRTIDVRQAFARSKRGAKLVDVRSAREFSHAGHPKGARSVPPQLIKKDKTGLGRDDDVLVICLSGHRSQRQAQRLVDMGFTKVVNVDGGLRAWKKAGLPVKR